MTSPFTHCWKPHDFQEDKLVVADEAVWNEPHDYIAMENHDFATPLVEVPDVFRKWEGEIVDKSRNNLTKEFNQRGEWLGNNVLANYPDVLARIFSVIDSCPHCIFCIPTEYPEQVKKCWPWTNNVRDVSQAQYIRCDNVLLMVKASTQAELDQRGGNTYETLCDYGYWVEPKEQLKFDVHWLENAHWLYITSQEPVDIEHVRSLCQQAKEAGVPVWCARTAYYSLPEEHQLHQWDQQRIDCYQQLPEVVNESRV